MSDLLLRVFRSLCIVVATLAAVGAARALAPSDCQARNADSTCNSAVERASDPSAIVGQTLYNGPLGGVPAQGYAYWGYDFLADATGVETVYQQDMYVNHSAYAVTIKLTFDIPTDHPCGSGCLPGVHFLYGPSWSAYSATPVIDGSTLSLEYRVAARQPYAWAIGLWEATNPRLTVSVDRGVSTTLAELGLPQQPAIAQEIPAVTSLCYCVDLSRALCSKGSHFSNGLDGPWYQSTGLHFYVRAGAFDDCLGP